MPDSRFFKRSSRLRIGDIADEFLCELNKEADKDFYIEDIAPLKSADKKDLSFFDNIKYKSDFMNTQAGACFVNPEMVSLAPKDTICLITKKPYKAYALLAQKLYPENLPEAFISLSAYIDPTAKIGKDCVIEHGAYVGPGVELGDECWLEPQAVIRENVKIGDKCRIGVGSCVSHSIIGNYVRLYTGVRVGQDGFGFAMDIAGHVKVPQLGRVLIGDHVEVGANTTIDRGAGPDTIIGQGTWIDNLVQIGHNVVIGKGCVIVAQVGISGSTVIEDFVAIGGQAGIAGHLKIGMGVQIAAQSGVMSDIAPGEVHMGSPSFPKGQFLRQVAAVNGLIKNKKKA